jgi:glutaredoxin
VTIEPVTKGSLWAFFPGTTFAQHFNFSRSTEGEITMVLVALLASSGSSQWQLKLCEKAKTLLSDLRVPFEVVDMEDKEKRNTLFQTAGSVGNYPQFFMEEANKITHLGDFDAIKRLIDQKSFVIFDAVEIEGNQNSMQETSPHSQNCRTASIDPPQQNSLDILRIHSPDYAEATDQPEVVSISKGTKTRQFQISATGSVDTKSESLDSSTDENVAESISPPISSLRPSVSRGWSFDKCENGTIENGISQIDRTLTIPAPTLNMRPTCVRGNSFDSILLHSVENEIFGTTTKASPTENCVQALELEAVHLSVTRGPSFDTIEQENMNDDRDSGNDLTDEIEASVCAVHSLRPSLTRGHSYDGYDDCTKLQMSKHDENRVMTENSSNNEKMLLFEPSSTNNTQYGNDALYNARELQETKSILDATSEPEVKMEISSKQLHFRPGSKICHADVICRDFFEVNQSPWLNDNNSMHEKIGMSNNTGWRGHFEQDNRKIVLSPTSSRKEATTPKHVAAFKEKSTHEKNPRTEANKLQDIDISSIGVRRLNSESATEAWHSDQTYNDTCVTSNQNQRDTIDTPKLFTVAPGPSWLYS